MADDEDYLSDAWLTQLEQTDTSTTLTGQKRKPAAAAEEEARKRQRTEGKLTERMAATREEGLSKPIDSSNIGFRLLASMGYKPGTGLGKEGRGRAEPVPIAIKQDKGGLGKDTLRKQQISAAEEAKRRLEALNAQKFKEHTKKRSDYKQLRADLSSCKATCESLDRGKGIEDNPLWYEPPREKTEEDKAREAEEEEARLMGRRLRVAPEDEEEPDPAEMAAQLDKLLRYLRDTYKYCFYCAIQFESAEDLGSSCPGPYLGDHDEGESLVGTDDNSRWHGDGDPWER